MNKILKSKKTKLDKISAAFNIHHSTRNVILSWLGPPIWTVFILLTLVIKRFSFATKVKNKKHVNQKEKQKMKTKSCING